MRKAIFGVLNLWVYAVTSKNGFLSITAARAFARSICNRSRSFMSSITNSYSEDKTIVLLAELRWS